ncbi:F0F1 ATP synthase subunit epsilon [Ottowia sp.]|uniref:F0F1 ATP synthase subunit epsilon n=1 Tax=Ottowia sp. TaxID=1898956 RepID=UPI002CA79D7E|nr:F0F1 ATP synthase subunit epsilon [Ottowia sp.]HRN74286.1 F0F1 ATP synthase subunit epsilon [Ottowia sp.]HRQ01354.1 F0F1 ATP synthase subunit epsilon [Ottowia sp.]
MSLAEHMHVSLRVPTRLLHEGGALRLVAMAENGSFGMLPNHADHVAPLVPSVLVLTDTEGKEHFFGIDHGLLVKRGHQVDIAVRRAVRGDNLDTLAETIDIMFTQIDEEERSARTAMARLEIGMVRHFGQLNKPA